jgi:hypothetical protein
MSRLPVDDDRVVRLAEESLFVVGEVKAHITKETRLVRFLGGLDEADKLELAHAQADVDEAIVRLRAAKGQLSEVERRCAQKREIRARIVADFDLESKEVDDIARVIAIDATAVGVKHIHPELLHGCSPAEKAQV